nr:tripartite tricarboxylate transporter substrate binding protein [Pseudomonas sp.]
MNKTRRTLHAALLLAGATALLPGWAHAQKNWPAKPITVIVPYTPGGFTDTVARTVTQKLSERLGQTVLVENKPGANSIIGVDQMTKAAPDGYTFAVVIAAYSANPSLYKSLPYDPKKDVQAVSLIGISPLFAAVPNNAPYKTVPELIAHAKANPGKLNFGSSGNGSAAHLSTEPLKELTGTDMVHVPYRGTAPALADLIGGQIQLLLDTPSSLLPQAQGGKLRLIGFAADKRLDSAPDVPTFEEQGVKGMIASTWAGMIAPAGTPDEIVERVSKEIAEIVRSDDVKQAFDRMGIIPQGSTPAEFDQFITDETDKWGKVIKSAGVTLE